MFREPGKEDQMLSQAWAALAMGRGEFRAVIPMGIKVIGQSEIFVVEFSEIPAGADPETMRLGVASQAVYELVPPIKGIGRKAGARPKRIT